MQQSPSSEANSSLTSQEIPRTLRNPEVHYRIHNSPPLNFILSEIKPIHVPHHTSWRSILILSSHLRLGLPNGLFPSGFSSKTLYTPLLSPISATCPAYLILLDLITGTIFGEQYRSLSTSLCSFLHSSGYLVPLRPKCSPQHPILKHPQPTFLPQWKRPGFAPIRNNRKNHSLVLCI